MGNQLGKFTILNQLGEGGFAKVYAVQLNGTKQKFALKVIEHDQEMPYGYQHEINLNLRLSHPHILPICDYWVDTQACYLLMPLMTAGNLSHHLLIHQTLSVQETANILMQLASAVDYLHKQHIVHLDIKPDNILMDNEGNIYLSDFGIARDLRLPQPITRLPFLGSPRYVAPEQLRRETITTRTDIYSIGLLAYQLLTGSVPFEARDLTGLCKQQLHTPVPSLQNKMPYLPLELNTLIAKASRKKASERYETASEFANEFYELALRTASFA